MGVGGSNIARRTFGEPRLVWRGRAGEKCPLRVVNDR